MKENGIEQIRGHDEILQVKGEAYSSLSEKNVNDSDHSQTFAPAAVEKTVLTAKQIFPTPHKMSITLYCNCGKAEDGSGKNGRIDLWQLYCLRRRHAMGLTGARFVGVELYFDDPQKAKSFYAGILGLQVAEEIAGHHTKFDSEAGFICLEKKGVESYPSKDKAVLFFEVADLQASIAAIGRDQLVRVENSWAVLHDPEGHNVLLLESRK